MPLKKQVFILATEPTSPILVVEIALESWGWLGGRAEWEVSRDNKENHFKKCDCEEEERFKALWREDFKIQDGRFLITCKWDRANKKERVEDLRVSENKWLERKAFKDVTEGIRAWTKELPKKTFEISFFLETLSWWYFPKYNAMTRYQGPEYFHSPGGKNQNVWSKAGIHASIFVVVVLGFNGSYPPISCFTKSPGSCRLDSPWPVVPGRILTRKRSPRLVI